MNFQKKTGVVILAAGKGKRMQGQLSLPKVLYPLGGKPIMSHLLEALDGSNIKTKPVIVIAPNSEIIWETFGKKYEYAIQQKQLGTGHAVLSAKDKLQNFDHVLVLYGDHPFVTIECVNQLVSKHIKTGSTLTLTTVDIMDFNDWRETFYNFGRILRDKDGKITRIVEKKDASNEELKITEVNPGYYCFKANWLWDNLSSLNCNNAQNEYYVTDLVEAALKQKEKVLSLTLFDPCEALGINTPEQLNFAEQILKELKH